METGLFDAFLSYATEDEQFADSLVEALQFCGFTLWFAPLNLKIGDRLLDSINAGLMLSRSGLLLLSPHFIAKQWTRYELDVVLRQHIEQNKSLLPIWHNVTKKQLETWNPGITGIVGLSTGVEFKRLTESISDVLASGARLRGVPPVWESPFHRFEQGRGELHANTINGRVFHLWKAVEFPDSHFPIFANGKRYQREDLLYHAATAIAHRSIDVDQMIGEEARKRISDLCKSRGFDPKKMA